MTNNRKSLSPDDIHQTLPPVAGGGEFGSWAQVGIAIESETSLTNQPRGPQLEYRVKAVDVGGESIPSNTVAVVL